MPHNDSCTAPRVYKTDNDEDTIMRKVAVPAPLYSEGTGDRGGPGMAGSAMMDTHLEFGVLGPLEMKIDQALVPLGTPKQRAVLAMLVINRNRPVGVDTLITAL